MAYDGKILHRATLKYEEDRLKRRNLWEECRDIAFKRQPRLQEIDRELQGTMSRIIASALRRGTDPGPALERLRDENLSLQQERKALLLSMGLPSDYLEEKINCPHCGDTGYRNGEVCRCLRAYYARAQKEELSALLDLGAQCFDSFSLDWYSGQMDMQYGISPRENMETVYEICADFEIGRAHV